MASVVVVVAARVVGARVVGAEVVGSGVVGLGVVGSGVVGSGVVGSSVVVLTVVVSGSDGMLHFDIFNRLSKSFRLLLILRQKSSKNTMGKGKKI